MMAPIAALPMLVWSSPFPIDPIPGLESVPFPGPAGTLLVYDSPDRILLRWKAQGHCDGAELERLQQGYAELAQLKLAGEHTIQPRWQIAQDDAPAPTPDGITAALLMLWLQAKPDALSSYLELDPDYLQRLLKAQGQPRHLLHQWLTEPVIAMQIDAPLEEQLRQTMEELGQLQRSQAAMKSLMDQVNDQQRRTRRLLATRLFQAQEPDAAG